MKLTVVFRSVIIAMFAVAAMLPGMNASAAIPCKELPVIEPDPDMVVPMIYIELPISVEEALGSGQEADRAGATELTVDEAGSVRSAAKNQFRCLGYNNDKIFIGNATPEQRVQMFARPAIEAEVERYITLDSLYLERLGEPIGLADGRYLIDFGIIVDGNWYLTGELIFSKEADGLYLDGSTLHEDAVRISDAITVDLSTRSTPEVKIIEASNGDMVAFNNLEEEVSADVVIEDTDGESVYEGFAPAVHMVGGDPTHIFMIHDLEPGEYKITFTFDDEAGTTYNQTLIVDEGGNATPAASPEASPAT